jgi:hypothetical protein
MQESIVRGLKEFRETIHSFFPARRDAAMDLVDALSASVHAKSVVELSLSPLHRRNYASIPRVVDEFYPAGRNDGKARQQHSIELEKILAKNCPLPEKRTYHLFCTDVTSNGRPHAKTLSDRSFVHAPTVIAGNKPVTIGHQYSTTVYLPEKAEGTSAWIYPVSCERVTSDQRGSIVGMQQIARCIAHPAFQRKLCISVGDSAYSQPECIWIAGQNPDHVHVSRCRSNRKLYRMPEGTVRKGRGRKCIFGSKFRLKDMRHQRFPDSMEIIPMPSDPEKTVKVSCWENMLMRGDRKHDMSQHPVRLLKIELLNRDGKPLYKKPLWLVVSGKRRTELALQEIFLIYRQRFDIEHFFRFAKNRLLMDKFQTPESDHEEAWWWLCMIAHAQLYLSRDLVQNTPTPWEKYLPKFHRNSCPSSPCQTQKGFSQIIRQIGTPASAPKPRNKSAGRAKGEVQVKRIHPPVIRKGAIHKKVDRLAA